MALLRSTRRLLRRAAQVGPRRRALLAEAVLCLMAARLALISRIPIGQGQGPSLTNRVLGQTGGSEEVTITTATLPAHSHMAMVSTADADSPNVTNLMPAKTGGNDKFYTIPATGKPAPTPTAMAPTALQSAGVGMPHNNLMPLLCVTYIIALEGIFPSRN